MAGLSNHEDLPRTMTGPLILVGCGKMGGALLRGWLDRGLAGTKDAPVRVIEPDEAAFRPFAAAANVTRVADAGGAKPAVVVLAVKPQTMDRALAGIAAAKESNPLFLSIAAGKTLGYFAGHLGGGAAVVRAMPNTPASVGRGATVAVANARVTPAMRESDDDAIARARVYVDTRAGATKEAGDIVQPLASGLLKPEAIVADLHELARGEKAGRRSDTEITLFKSVGAALEDLAAGIAVYKALK